MARLGLTDRDRTRLWLAGVAGAGAFVTYTLFHTWASRKTNRGGLKPEPEALGKDSELYYLFVQLDEYRKNNDAAFRRALNSADQLIFLKEQLRNKKIRPSIYDVPDALVYKASCEKALMAFVKSTNARSRRDNTEEQTAKIHIIVEHMFECLKSRFKSVEQLSQF